MNLKLLIWRCPMKMIVAVDEENGIAKDGKIPWSCKEDLNFFRFLTFGQTVIMGHNTFRSLGCKPLPKRKNIVISSNPTNPYVGPNSIPFYEWAGISCLYYQPPTSFVIGGSQIYKYALDNKLIDELYITRIRGKYDCDQFFDFNFDYKMFVIFKSTENCQFMKYILKK